MRDLAAKDIPMHTFPDLARSFAKMKLQDLLMEAPGAGLFAEVVRHEAKDNLTATITMCRDQIRDNRTLVIDQIGEQAVLIIEQL